MKTQSESLAERVLGAVHERAVFTALRLRGIPLTKRFSAAHLGKTLK